MEVVNKNGDKFNLSEGDFIKLSAATILLEKTFTEYEGTVDKFFEEAEVFAGEKGWLPQDTDTLMIGNAVFVGILTYGKTFVDKMLSTDTAGDQVFCLFNYAMLIANELERVKLETADKQEDDVTEAE